MDELSAVDPGVRYFADARFNEVGQLVFVEWVPLANGLVSIWGHYEKAPAIRVVSEGQRVGRATPKRIIQLAHTAGACAAQGQESGIVLNGTSWKGGVRKELMTRRIVHQLSPSELDVLDEACQSCYELGTQVGQNPKSQLHDLTHAIGVGLYDLGQLKSAGRGQDYVTSHALLVKWKLS